MTTDTKVKPTAAERAHLEPKRGLGRIDRVYAVEGIEVRAADDGDATIATFFGHASVTGVGYEMYGGPSEGGWIEYVDPGAFKKTLSENPDVAFLINHTGMTLARTKAGTMALAEDTIGLAVNATLDRRVSIINDLVLLMEARNLDEMSFAFRVVKQRWLNADGEEVPWWDLSGIERHITEVSIDKGDVSVVNYGASPHTDASVRSFTDAVRTHYNADSEVDDADVRSAIGYLTSLLGDTEEENENERSAADDLDVLEVQKVELDLRTRRLAQAQI